jgi:hypothetical protein
MRTAVALATSIGLLLAPAGVHGWGPDAHRFLTHRALNGLPADIRPFFASTSDYISEHSADPDMWSVAGLKTDLGVEGFNHYFSIDAYGDAPPFANVPRDWNAYVAKYGADRANLNGRLPWRTEELYDRLVATFRDLGRAAEPASDTTARFLVAVLSHYVEDAHVPFHATVNADGQLTNQRGVHTRFETELVQRYLPTLKLAPVTIRPITSAREYIFDTLARSEPLAAGILAADRDATVGRRQRDSAYFNAFMARARPVLEQQLGDAASGAASVVVSAWEKAGRPKLGRAGPRAASPGPALTSVH